MANGLLDLLGGLGTTPPAYMEGLLGAQQTEDLRKRSIGTGLANALIGYLATPKNQNLGLGRILANTAQAGIGGAQGVYSSAIEDYQTKAKIDEMNRNKAIAERDLKRQMEMESLAPQLIKTTPAQYADVQGNPYFIPAATAPDATSPNYNLQSVMPEPTRQLITPEQRSIDMNVMQRLASLSKDPLATLKTTADLVPSLRKAGMLQTGQQDNPFEIYTVGAQSPTVQKLANQYAKSYQNGQIDSETADKRILELGKMEETYSGKQTSAEQKQAEADRQFELRKLLANNQISQQQFQQEMARGNLALREQLAAGKAQKVLPPSTQKIIDASVTAAADNVNLADKLDNVIGTVVQSKINFNPANNMALATKSGLGSTAQDVMVYNTVQEFKKTFVNEKLRLNKGTQTEGDAIRAMDEVSKAKSTPDLIRSLQNLRESYARLAEQENKLAESKLKSFGATPDKGYPAYDPYPVPSYKPVIYDGKGLDYKKIPIGGTYINGITGQTMTKTKD